MSHSDLNVAQCEGSLGCTSGFVLRGFMWESHSTVHSAKGIKLLTQNILHVMRHTMHNNLLCIDD